MSKLQTAAQDLLVVVCEDESRDRIVEAYKDTCGSDAWDDWSQQEASFIDILKHLAEKP